MLIYCALNCKQFIFIIVRSVKSELQRRLPVTVVVNDDHYFRVNGVRRFPLSDRSFPPASRQRVWFH